MNMLKKGLPMLFASLLISMSPISMAQIAESEDCLCDGKLTTLTLRYLGSSTTSLSVVQKNGDVIHYDGNLFSNEIFSLTGTDQRGKKLSNTTFGPFIHLYMGDGTDLTVHTSCSVEINIGDRIGNFRVIAGTSRNNGAICGDSPGPIVE